MRFLASITLLALAACGTVAEGQRERFVRNLEPVAQPADMVATELRFARAARENGQWTAFAEIAADDAVFHRPEGIVPASTWLSGRADPGAAIQWTPTRVLASCDGETMMTRGKYANPDGTWGYYSTAWKRQRSGEYRWTYYLSAPDAALTERENRERPAPIDDEGVITVEAVPDIRASVADCSEPAYGLVVRNQPGDISDTVYSEDESLIYRWAGSPDGDRALDVHLWTGERYDAVVTDTIPALP